MTTDWKALCAELTDCLEKADWPGQHKELFQFWADIARATLSEPEPEGPTPQPADGEVAELVAWLREYEPTEEDGYPADRDQARFRRAADLLERLSPQPVPVSERLPEPGDCDAEGRCWWGRAESEDWSARWHLATHESVVEFCKFFPGVVWLPAHALPVP